MLLFVFLRIFSLIKGFRLNLLIFLFSSLQTGNNTIGEKNDVLGLVTIPRYYYEVFPSVVIYK